MTKIKNPTSGALRNRRKGDKVPQSQGASAAATAQNLADRINADRKKRKLTWPEYAEFLGVKMSTLYKIAKGSTKRPHELTVADIEERLDAADARTTTTEGADREVVPSGQQHPERPEN